jgi:hypothetical protein
VETVTLETVLGHLMAGSNFLNFDDLLEVQRALDECVKERRVEMRSKPKGGRKAYVPLKDLLPGTAVWLNVRGRGFPKGMYLVEQRDRARSEVVFVMHGDKSCIKRFAEGDYMVSWFPLAEQPVEKD